MQLLHVEAVGSRNFDPALIDPETGVPVRGTPPVNRPIPSAGPPLPLRVRRGGGAN